MENVSYDQLQGSRLVPVLCNQTEPNVSVQVLNRPTDLSSVIPSYTDLLKLTCPELEELFTSYLEKMQYDCKKIVRYGNTGDGGWDICEDQYYIPSKNSIVYSFGIANDFSFDDAISKRRHVRVHSFDPTNNMSDHQRSDLITFHALGIADYTGTTPKGWKVARLTDIKTRLGHNQGTVEIVKIDIEEAEWLILPEIIFSESLKGTKQLLMEWHIYPDKKRKKTIITHALQILRHLYRMGFRLFKLHYNPLCNEHPKSDYRYCPEMYFVNINKNM
ncbi:hypothetical protein SNE40_021878 [Patella caerulea]|uniref:Methyltransferase domain-containing protein n=1 Tax=Patella caerulea TaxID=87958 RepID=A0AAN8GC50_PATCE